MGDKIYLTEQSVKELLEGKSVFNDDTEIIPPKTNELGLKPLKFRKTCLNCGNDTWYIELRVNEIVFACAKCGYRMSAKYTELVGFT